MEPVRIDSQLRPAIWKREATWLMVILGAAGFLFFARLPGPLLEPEEARYAEIPRQMLCHGRFLVPLLDGQDYLDKPPLLYWAVMACYASLGVHVWSARLVPCLAAWLTVVVVYGWVRRTTGPKAAAFSAIVLSLTGDYVYRGPMLTMNGPLALFVSAALAAGHLALAGDAWQRTWWLISALACGAGVLMKGPIAIALVVVPLATLLGAYSGLRWQGVKALAGYLAVVLVLAGPWFLAVAFRQPGFAEYFFWRHHIERCFFPFDHAEPFWFYLPRFAIGFFPWSLVLAVTAVRALRGTVRPSVRSPEWVALLAAAWGGILFSLAGSKRPVYLVPLWPVLAVAAGMHLSRTVGVNAGAKLMGLGETGWRWVGGVTFGFLVAGVVLWLPEYAKRFSVPRSALLGSAGPAARVPPVFCYPHPWLSVQFYLGRDEVSVFREGEIPQLLDALRGCPEALLVIRSGRVAEEFLRRLPPEMEFARRSQSGVVTVGIVRRTSLSSEGLVRRAGGRTAVALKRRVPPPGNALIESVTLSVTLDPETHL
jgi:4-amino-4-deoxy-L-arabinose transferase-like glycosyltransferase